MRFPHLLFVLSAICLSMSSCGTANRFLKARPAKLSGFFEQPELATDGRRSVGFQKVWVTPDKEVLASSSTKNKIYIAPVSLDYLRPVNRALASREVAAGGTQRRSHEMAEKLREEFIAAFQRSREPRYQLASKPAADTVELRLALTELTPTSAQGNVITTVLKLVVTPFAAVGGFFTKGNIAVEGKVLVPMAKQGGSKPFFQFADKEADKFTFFSLRDYQSYGHAMHTMRDWATQFEEVTRAKKGQRVRDSSAVTLKVF